MISLWCEVFASIHWTMLSAVSCIAEVAVNLLYAVSIQQRQELCHVKHFEWRGRLKKGLLTVGIYVAPNPRTTTSSPYPLSRQMDIRTGEGLTSSFLSLSTHSISHLIHHPTLAWLVLQRNHLNPRRNILPMVKSRTCCLQRIFLTQTWVFPIAPWLYWWLWSYFVRWLF